MDLKAVTSSQIAKVGYDPKTNTLGIEFKTGGVYHYDNFTQEDYDALKKAKSVGSHFYKHIKPHATKFPFTKQEAKKAEEKKK